MLSSGITKNEVIAQSGAVLDVLKFTDNLQNKTTPAGRATDTLQMPDKESTLSLKDLVSDPSRQDLFTNLKKIGDGASGEVFIADWEENNIEVAIKTIPIIRGTTFSFVLRSTL
uniref:Protein kinase domain-containing protein n=1 Tax=Arcella intermedia TaxID=1963864 RepID=A0A6B2LPH3_9EUKA